MTIARSSFMLLILVAASGCATNRPQIQWNSEYDFSAISTFAWQDTPDYSLQSSNPFMHSRIVAAIEYELTDWLTEVTSSPDVYVNYHTASASRVRLSTNSWGYSAGGYNRGRWGYYGYGYGGPVYSQTTVHEYEEGTLVVDIWDANSKQLIWRGAVTRVFADNPQRAEQQMLEAVRAMAREGRRLWRRENR